MEGQMTYQPILNSLVRYFNDMNSSIKCIFLHAFSVAWIVFGIFFVIGVIVQENG